MRDNQKNLILLCNALIVSTLSYGSGIYTSAAEPRWDALNVVHHDWSIYAMNNLSLVADAGGVPLELVEVKCDQILDGNSKDCQVHYHM